MKVQPFRVQTQYYGNEEYSIPDSGTTGEFRPSPWHKVLYAGQDRISLDKLRLDSCPTTHPNMHEMSIAPLFHKRLSATILLAWVILAFGPRATRADEPEMSSWMFMRPGQGALPHDNHQAAKAKAPAKVSEEQSSKEAGIFR